MNAEINSEIQNVGYAKVIVALKPQLAATHTAMAEHALAAHFKVPSERQAMSLAVTASANASKRFKRDVAVPDRAVRIYPRLGLAIGYVDGQGLQGLEKDQQVGAVVPAPEISLIKPVEVHAAKRPADVTWGIKRTNAPRLWAAGFTGRDVLVGHLDTGVDGDHPALRGAIGAFAEFDMAGDQVPGAKPWDSGDHGTHTAGTILGRAVGHSAIGVAPEARLVSGMVIEGGLVVDRILAGMEWVLSQGARILNMSLGLRGYTPAFQVVADALRAQNVLLVVAVGNEGPMTSRSPGNYANVLSVGAIDEQDRVATFSGSQTFSRPADPIAPDLVAPGDGVLSCVPGGAYASMRGTSMATPHVAGIAALLLQAKPTATVDELEGAIFASCTRPSAMPENRGNRGLPDAVAAFVHLTGQQPVATLGGPARRRVRGRRGSAPVKRKAKRGGKKRATRRAGRTR